jgi:hypothetical protein
LLLVVVVMVMVAVVVVVVEVVLRTNWRFKRGLGSRDRLGA